MYALEVLLLEEPERKMKSQNLDGQQQLVAFSPQQGGGGAFGGGGGADGGEGAKEELGARGMAADLLSRLIARPTSGQMILLMMQVCWLVEWENMK